MKKPVPQTSKMYLNINTCDLSVSPPNRSTNVVFAVQVSRQSGIKPVSLQRSNKNKNYMVPGIPVLGRSPRYKKIRTKSSFLNSNI